MHNITFISTVHKEIGKCNADELSKIIEQIKPEIIFLEALEETYSKYDKFNFESFGVFHYKLEIAAIQKYNYINSFTYVPVLHNGLCDAFDRKYNIVCQYPEFQKLFNNFNALLETDGFKLLNSAENIKLQDEMLIIEDQLLNNSKIAEEFNVSIDEYENSMLRNIYSYCYDNTFNTAIFMCGAAHRKSIIEKIEKSKTKETINLN